MAALIAIFRGIPILGWIALAALAWGGFHKLRAADANARAKAEQLQTATQRADLIHGALVRQTRVVQAQEATTREAVDQARRARAAADSAADAERRLHERLAAASGAGGAGDPAAAGDGAAAAGADLVPADVLRRCTGRVRQLAALADERGIAGTSCERAYDALTAPGAKSPPRAAQ